jgi:hypothetical protein
MHNTGPLLAKVGLSGSTCLEDDAGQKSDMAKQKPMKPGDFNLQTLGFRHHYQRYGSKLFKIRVPSISFGPFFGNTKLVNFFAIQPLSMESDNFEVRRK